MPSSFMGSALTLHTGAAAVAEAKLKDPEGNFPAWNPWKGWVSVSDKGGAGTPFGGAA